MANTKNDQLLGHINHTVKTVKTVCVLNKNTIKVEKNGNKYILKEVGSPDGRNVVFAEGTGMQIIKTLTAMMFGCNSANIECNKRLDLSRKALADYDKTREAIDKIRYEQ